MSDAVNEKGSPIQTYERPTGLKGLYYHPATQVSYLFALPTLCLDALLPTGGHAWISVFHVSRSVPLKHFQNLRNK